MNVTYYTNNNALVLINFTASSPNGISSLWYYNGTSNVTYTSPISVNLSIGSYLFTFYANDSLNNINSTAVSFSVGPILPQINLSSPISSSNFINLTNPSILINFTASSPNGISSLWYYNGTSNVTYTSPISVNLSIGSYLFTFYANDSYNNVNSTTLLFLVIYSNLPYNMTYPGGVVVIHSNLSRTVYPASANSDLARGQALLNAYGNATINDSLYLSSGNFNITNNSIDLSLGLQGNGSISLHGSGKYVTGISSNIGLNCVILPATNSQVTDLSIFLTSSGTIYCGWGQYSGTYSWQNATIKNVYIRGYSDGILLGYNDGHPFFGTIINVTVYTEYDAFNLRDIGLNTTDQTANFKIYDSSFYTDDFNGNAGFGCAQSRAIATYSGLISVWNSTLVSTNGCGPFSFGLNGYPNMGAFSLYSNLTLYGVSVSTSKDMVLYFDADLAASSKLYVDQFVSYHSSLGSIQTVQTVPESVSSVSFTNSTSNITVLISSPILNNYSIVNASTNAIVLLNFTGLSVNNISSQWYYNGTSNVTYTSPVLLNLSANSYNFTFYAEDTLGNINSSSFSFKVNSNLPSFSVNSPLNQSYNTNNIPIDFTASDVNNISSQWYYNGTSNVTYTNPTSVSLANGNYNFIFYANDTFNNFNSTNVSFTVSTSSSSGSSGGGGGGGNSNPVTAISLYSLKIITPAPISSSRNGVIIEPIQITNNGQLRLNGLTFRTIVTKDGVSTNDVIANLDNYTISSLNSGQSKNLTLTLNVNSKTDSQYIIEIDANVTQPVYSDSAKISLSTALNQDTSNKLQLAKNLISSNSECAGLNENYNMATDLYNQGDFAGADKVLNDTIISCRTLISQNESGVLSNNGNVLSYVVIGIILVAIVGFVLYVVRYRRMNNSTLS